MKSTLSSAQWAALFAAFSAASALADPPPANDPPGPTLHAETRVVQIDVVAADSGGRPVVDLTKADFTVADEGKHRAIDIFSINGGAVRSSAAAPPAAPMTRELPPNMFSNRNPGPPNVPAHSTVIVLDQVNAFLEDAAYARDQAMSLMKKLPPDERIALYVIARKEGLALLQDYTTDRALLTRSLKNYAPRGLSPSPPPPPTTAIRDGQNAGPGAGTAAAVAAFSTAGGDQPRPPGLPPGRTGLEEKLVAWYENSRSARLSLQAFAEQLALVPGRKSVYWVTQAFPSWVMKEKGMGSPPAMEKPAWDKTITALNEANVAVNTVDSRWTFGSTWAYRKLPQACAPRCCGSAPPSCDSAEMHDLNTSRASSAGCAAGSDVLRRRAIDRGPQQLRDGSARDAIQKHRVIRGPQYFVAIHPRSFEDDVECLPLAWLAPGVASGGHWP
jgi:VWFA-related protein